VDDIGSDATAGALDPLGDLVAERLRHRRRRSLRRLALAERTGGHGPGHRVVVYADQLAGGPIGLREVERLEYFHLLLLWQHQVFLLGVDGCLGDSIDARGEPRTGGPSWGG